MQNKGQISISWVLGIAASIALAAFGTITATNVKTNEKVGVAQKETSLVSERTAKLETAVPIIQKDIAEVKTEIKEINQTLKDINAYFRIKSNP